MPGRVLGAVFRGATGKGKLAYWASAGLLGHNPDADRLRFDTLIFGSSNLNEGVLVSGRLDLRPSGAVTFSDSDDHTPELKYTWSLAGYAWENDGHNNPFTEDPFSEVCHKIDNIRSCLRAGYDFQQSHISNRIKEMSTQKVCFEISA